MDPTKVANKTEDFYYREAKKEIFDYFRIMFGSSQQIDTKSLFIPKFGNFITCNYGFLSDILNLKQEVIDYCTKPREFCNRPYNVLLGAASGSGKSFLVKELSNLINLEGIKTSFVEVQVSSFRNIEDLFDLFRIIQSENLNGKTPIVLVDEVDSPVGNKNIYQNLLGPMWTSEYYEGIKKHNLGKVIFVFAGSTIFQAQSPSNYLPKNNIELKYTEYRRDWFENSLLTGEKIIDFIDRIDHSICIPPITRGFENSKPEIELILLANTIIKKYHNINNNLSKIEARSSLIIIDHLIRYKSRRKAESIIFNSTMSTKNAFSFENLPNEIKEKYSTIDEYYLFENKFFLTTK